MKLKAMKTVWIVRAHNGFNDYGIHSVHASRESAGKMEDKLEAKGITCWTERFRVRKTK